MADESAPQPMPESPATVAPPPKEEVPPPSPSSSESEALRLLSLAESKLRSSSLASALKHAKRAARLYPSVARASQMVTALKILRASPSDHYAVLRLPPFSPFSSIRRQYKSLSLALHPDKSSSSVAAEEAFKRVADSFRFLSDRSLKRDLDLRLRRNSSPTFWTACATCRLLHEFDRRYVGYRLVCPSCSKSFLAVEVPTPPGDDDKLDSDRASARVRVTTRLRSSSRPRISRFTKKARPSRPEKTLAQMQLELIKVKDKGKEKEKEKEKGKDKVLLRVKEEEKEVDDDLGLMAVEDSDFYDFDKDRTEKSFKKGQVWAIYDDDDGMPRHYGLIEEVFSTSPFRVRMSWLDIQNQGDESVLLLENSGLHISCGRFKVGRKVDVDSVNMFSHLVECERAARDLYRIYPKKGSVWALYGEQSVGGAEEGRHYDIVVFLTSYSEMHGLSMGYLEKVEGYKTIFKRQAIGCHAIRWLEKDDVRLFSHQIPARKLSETEGMNLPRESWELDPASLPPALLSIAWDR
ncbi:uncharacterized protein [Typha latifolia]|uniref:uncharacterized protein n=1 Tax=Typha latifolia TaxID=4733 RepID=UPI003C2F0DF2